MVLTSNFSESESAMKRIALRTISLLAILALFSTWGFGQAISGNLNGVVKDTTGAVVAGASVTATHESTGFKQTVTTSSTGEFHFIDLPLGHYRIEATSGSLKGAAAGVPVELNITRTVNITAAVAGTATTVEVAAQTVAVDTTNAQIENTFTTKQLEDLPIVSSGNGGSGVLNLSLLNAGVASGGGIGLGTGPSISGQRPRNNNFTVEGVDNNNKAVTGPLMQIPNDDVESFTVLQNQFAPEFGHSSGGQFNQTIKSGTNTWHGSAWEYFQNKDLNAIDYQVAQSQNFTDVKNVRYDDNRFGGYFGGPIIKNKLFFFTSWQYEPIGYAANPSTACAPTAAGYASLAGVFGNTTNFKVLQKYLPPGGTPDANSACGATTISVLGQDIPIGPVGFVGPSYQNFLTNVNSGDWNISQKDNLRVRYAFENQTGIDTAAQLSTFWTATPIKFNLLTLGEYHTFSSNVNNEFRFGFNRFNQPIPVGNQVFPGQNVFPNLTIGDLGGVNIGPDPNAPQFTIQNTYQVVDNLNWVKGKHSFKFGAEYRWSISPQSFTQRSRGDYQWFPQTDAAGNVLQSGLEQYLLDQAPTTPLITAGFAERSEGIFTYYGNQNSWYFFANDDWKVTPNLTLNLGLRYEWTQTPLSQRQAQPLNAISSVPGLINFGAPQAQGTNFLPRVGFSWSPGGTGTTVIRGGFSMAVDVLYDNLGILSMPPQVQQTCDTGYNDNGTKISTASCDWSVLAFMANGGLPSKTPDPHAPPLDTPEGARSVTGAFIPNQQLPYSETWTLGLQHQFGRSYVLDVRYVGTRGIHLPVQQRLNRQIKANPNEFLPTYLTFPGQAALDALPFTLKEINGLSSFVPAYANVGFNGSNLIGFEPWGASKYNGLQVQLNRNFTNGLQFQVAYTWSHAFDNSAADVFSTVITPRRPQDFQCFACDWSTSAYDRRNRFSGEILYQVPWYKNSSNWFMKNVVGNWQPSMIYQVESPEYATVRSGVDTNGNGDNAGDRAIFNPLGVPNTGTGVKQLKNTAGQVVAYQAVDPTAQYIVAGAGARSNIPRNTLALPRIDNFDFALLKGVNITERQQVQFQFQATNIFNHPQFVPGFVSDVAPALSQYTTSGNTTNALLPNSGSFAQFKNGFSSHPRQVVLVLKYIF
jgi:hypothetical protein